ncbi:hypothetical protein HDU96_004390, partial [Phlyctochytrium bullatum]
MSLPLSSSPLPSTTLHFDLLLTDLLAITTDSTDTPTPGYLPSPASTPLVMQQDSTPPSGTIAPPPPHVPNHHLTDADRAYAEFLLLSQSFLSTPFPSGPTHVPSQ